MKNSSNTIKPITASNGAIITIDDLIEAIDFADVNWDMAAFAFEETGAILPIDICILDFFKDQQAWDKIDKTFVEEYAYNKYNALTAAIERRAKVEWTYLASKRDWKHIMHKDQFKKICNLNPFEKILFNNAVDSGFKHSFSEYMDKEESQDYWTSIVKQDYSTYQVTICLTNQGKEKKDSTICPWTSEKAFIHIEEGNSRTELRLYHE